MFKIVTINSPTRRLEWHIQITALISACFWGHLWLATVSNNRGFHQKNGRLQITEKLTLRGYGNRKCQILRKKQKETEKNGFGCSGWKSVKNRLQPKATELERVATERFYGGTLGYWIPLMIRMKTEKKSGTYKEDFRLTGTVIFFWFLIWKKYAISPSKSLVITEKLTWVHLRNNENLVGEYTLIALL